MLTERGVKILKILVHSDEPIAISALAEQFELSERSIRYDIEKINKVLKPKKLPLIKKVSVGSLALSSQSKILDYIDSLENPTFLLSQGRNSCFIKLQLRAVLIYQL